MDLVGDLARASQDDVVAAHGTTIELEETGAKRARLGEPQVTLGKDESAVKGVGRGTRELENRAVGNIDAETGGAIGGGRICNQAIPDGLRALAANIKSADVGVVLPVDVVAVDGEHGAVFEAVRERAILTASSLIDVGADGDGCGTGEAARRIVVNDDRLGDGQAGRIRRKDGTVVQEDTAEDDFAPVRDGTGGRQGKTSDTSHRRDGVSETDARTVNVGPDGEVGRAAGGECHRHGVSHRAGDAAGVELEAHGGYRREAERSAVDASRAGVSIGAGEHPDALVRFEDAERLRGRSVRQDGSDGIEVGIDAAQLEHAVARRSQAGQTVSGTGVNDVR